jgi:hypothetical protein
MNFFGVITITTTTGRKNFASITITTTTGRKKFNLDRDHDLIINRDRFRSKADRFYTIATIAQDCVLDTF